MTTSLARAAGVAAALLTAFIAPSAEAQGQNLQQLLLSSPWCTFSYNKITGASDSKRYRFFNNGRYSTGSNAETYSSGAYGSVAGQSRGNGGGQWGVQGNMLIINGDAVNVRVKRNSNGYAVIVADGVEYSQCR